MAIKPSTSDGFANPLYDKLLQYCHKNADVIFLERWRMDWDEDEIKDALGGWSSRRDSVTLPPRPDPQVRSVDWQRTLLLMT